MALLTPPPMQLAEHPRVEDFLRAAQAELEQREVENSLVLGAALALRSAPAPPDDAFLATVHDAAGLAAAAFRSPPFPLVLAARREGGEALAHVAEALAATGRTVPAVVAPDPLAASFADLWTPLCGSPARVGMRQRLHALAAVEPLPARPGRLRRAEGSDLERVAGWMEAFDRETFGEGSPTAAREVAARRIAAGEVHLWEDGEPLSMSARARPTRSTVAVNAVYTPPELRGRGQATACVAALSRLLLEEGYARCVLFTDLANPTSNAIYARIGYRPVCDFTVLRFDTP